jgi:hypothetical protein
MRDAVVPQAPARWVARWRSKVPQRPTTSACLRAAALEIAGPSRRLDSVVPVVRHCTSDRGYNWRNLAAAVGLAGSRVDIGEGLGGAPPDRKRLLALGSTPNMQARLQPLCSPRGRMREVRGDSGSRDPALGPRCIVDPARDKAVRSASCVDYCRPYPT